MKARLVLALTAFALTLAAAQVPPNSCSAFCSRVRCIGDQICGLYVNSSGQTVCGCHPR
jgi:hypothetical protein